MADKEYIERRAILKEIDTEFNEYANHGDILHLFSECRASIIYAPAADVVEVIRCDTCRFYVPFVEEPSIMICELDKLYRHPYDFCSYGIRKDVNDG